MLCTLPLTLLLSCPLPHPRACSYDCFEASDAAIEAMNGQFLCNRAISVSYAFKKDTKGKLQPSPNCDAEALQKPL